MVQRYEQTRKLQWYKRGAAYVNALPRYAILHVAYHFNMKPKKH